MFEPLIIGRLIKTFGRLSRLSTTCWKLPLVGICTLVSRWFQTFRTSDYSRKTTCSVDRLAIYFSLCMDLDLSHVQWKGDLGVSVAERELLDKHRTSMHLTVDQSPQMPIISLTRRSSSLPIETVAKHEIVLLCGTTKTSLFLRSPCQHETTTNHHGSVEPPTVVTS